MSGYRVLLVDDSAITRTVLARTLTRAGFEVIEAEDGAEGAVIAFRERPDVVVTDLEMPVMDGYGLLRLLKGDAATRHIPVAVVTSHGEAPSRFWGLQTGADAYLTKENAGGDLAAVVQRLASAPRTGSSPCEAPPRNVTEVLGRVARHLDSALMKSTIAATMMERTVAAETFPAACQHAAQVLAEISGPVAIAFGIAESELVSVEVFPFVDLTQGNAEDLARRTLDHLLVAPGATVEVHIRGELARAATSENEPARLFTLPLRDSSGVVAFLPRNGAEFDGTAAPLIEALLRHVAMALDNARMAHRLRELSCRDGLTRLFNHRAIHERLGEELSRALRHKNPLSVALCDLDNFKAVNDTHGHLAGDTVLRAVSSCLRSTLRTGDVMGRHGGEEFLIVLPETGLEAARVAAERLRTALAENPVVLPSGEILTVTASFGVASHAECPQPLRTSALLTLADTRLYAAKAAGRNCVRP